jgi:ABC-type nickel/cobalt efflux system permease component RcnA
LKHSTNDAHFLSLHLIVNNKAILVVPNKFFLKVYSKSTLIGRILDGDTQLNSLAMRMLYETINLIEREKSEKNVGKEHNEMHMELGKIRRRIKGQNMCGLLVGCTICSLVLWMLVFRGRDKIIIVGSHLMVLSFLVCAFNNM